MPLLVLKKLGIDSNPSEVFVGKGDLKICSRFAGEQGSRSNESHRRLYQSHLMHHHGV